VRIWHDACTGKHVRYGITIARRLRERGHQVVLTAREHPDTLALAKLQGETVVTVGKYNPESLLSRLKEGANRLIEFAKLFSNNMPDVAISNQSPDLCRFAFGLGIPVILTADTPYAEAVHRLTIPLSDYLIISSGNPMRIFKRYAPKKIVLYEGVDEVAWIQGYMPSRKVDLDKPLIVVRQMETKAAYALTKTDVTERLAQKLAALGTVLFLPRYAAYRGKGIDTVKGFVDTAELVSGADLVVSMGGTIAREAALQGVPSLAITGLGRIYVNEFLSRKGFPIFTLPASEVLEMAKRCIGKKWNVKRKLADLENPVDIICKIVETEIPYRFKGGKFQ